MHDLYVYKTKIIDVYDGDTYTGFVDLGLKIYTELRIRLVLVDTPEIRGEERPEGLVVKDIVQELILNKDVIIQTYKDEKGKYGRYLAEIYLVIDGVYQALSQWLLDNNYAKVYMAVIEAPTVKIK